VKSANVGLAPRNDRPDLELPRVVDALRKSSKVLVVAHAHPDADALGSSLALTHLLRELGKDVTLFCATDIPHNCGFLPGVDTRVSSIPAEMSFDATIVCDVGHSSRIGPGLPERARLGTWLNIDHHLTSDDFGDVNLVDAHAAAVGVLVLRIVEGLGHALSKDAAVAIYTSILTDTGSFRYSSTNPEALQAAAKCVAAGADPWTVSSAIYEQNPVERLRLLRDVLGSLHVSPDGLFASLTVSWEMQEKTRTNADLTDGFINFARGIRGVEVACQFTEPAPGSHEPWRLSFRSRGRVNVAKVAGRFGGGGHHNAAGARIAGSLAEVQAQVGAAVADEFRVL